MRFVVIGEKGPGEHQIKQAFAQPRTQNPPHDPEQLAWQAKATPRCPEEKLSDRVIRPRKERGYQQEDTSAAEKWTV